MISKGTLIVDYITLWVDNKTGKPSELVYTVENYGVFHRREGRWAPFDTEETPGMYDDTRTITLEKEDSKELKLLEKFDSGKEIDIAEVAEYETRRYND